MKKKFVVKRFVTFLNLYGCDSRNRANPWLKEYCYKEWVKYTGISIAVGEKKIIEIEFRRIDG